MSEKRKPIVVRAGDAPEIQTYLADRIYEFNAQATGRFDGELFSAVERDESGVIRAGICGHTWAGCAYVSYLWVEESQRHRGLGTSLLTAAEEHAMTKGCSMIFLTTHSFQAPSFYARMGYERQSILKNHPIGHASLIFAKHLRPQST